MEVVRRNTDYALRMMVYLSENSNGRFFSARELSRQGRFSYQLGRKILQKLHKAGLVESCMGKEGGFVLSKKPSQIALMDVIKVLQGGIRLNRCLCEGDLCEFNPGCEISTRLSCLQLYIESYLGDISLAEIVQSKHAKSDNYTPNHETANK